MVVYLGFDTAPCVAGAGGTVFNVSVEGGGVFKAGVFLYKYSEV